MGKAAKRRGTGSRSVPHRLNKEERTAFERAKKAGYVDVKGSGWRRERGGAPLVNTWRNYCDARAHVSVLLHRRSTRDTVVVDMSPLRLDTAALKQGADRITAFVRQKHDQSSSCWGFAVTHMGFTTTVLADVTEGDTRAVTLKVLNKF